MTTMLTIPSGQSSSLNCSEGAQWCRRWGSSWAFTTHISIMGKSGLFFRCLRCYQIKSVFKTNIGKGEKFRVHTWYNLFFPHDLGSLDPHALYMFLTSSSSLSCNAQNHQDCTEKGRTGRKKDKLERSVRCFMSLQLVQALLLLWFIF